MVPAAFSACGSASETVAEVRGSSPISKSLIDHWIRIESVLSYDTVPKAPIPAGVVPIPPDYKACIAFLATRPFLRETGTPAATSDQLKARCVKHHAEIQEKAVNYMIAYRWTAGELARRGLTITQAEVTRAIANFQRKSFHDHREFQNYIAYTHLSPSDLHFIEEYVVMGAKLQELGVMRKGLTQQQQATELASLTKRWRARTTCKRAYVVPACSEYRGSVPPPL